MSRLKPINKSPKNQKVFHNMCFIIFCPKHRKIAVSDAFKERRELAIWLPFVYLSSDIKKRITVEESVSLILSDGNPVFTSQYKREQPFDSNVSFVCFERIKEYNFGFTRFVCFIRLHSDNPVLQCCRKTSRIIWLDIEKVLNDYIDCPWGPQIETNCRKFDERIQSLRINYFEVTHLFNTHPLPNIQKDILKSLNITEKQIKLFFIDFNEHCFPSGFMSFISFKDYLGKYGFKPSQKLMKRLCKSFIRFKYFNRPRGDHLLFDELLLGLAHIDPQCIFNDSRLAFVFRYYDFDRDGYLSKEELREMIEDIHENETSDMIDSIVNDYWFIINPFEEGLNYNKFWESVHNQTIILPHSLCRFENRILLKIISTLETRNRGIVSRIKSFVSHYCRKILKKN